MKSRFFSQKNSQKFFSGQIQNIGHHFIIPVFVLKRAIGCSNWDRRLKIAKIINAIKIAKKGFI